MPTPKQIYDKKRYEANRESVQARTNEWRKNNPEKYKQYRKRFNKRHPEADRIAQIKYRYNLTSVEFKALVLKQKGKCAICKVKPDYMLSIDHSHKTQEVRGLLCQRCNIAVGFIEIEGLLEKVQAYLH